MLQAQYFRVQRKLITRTKKFMCYNFYTAYHNFILKLGFFNHYYACFYDANMYENYLHFMNTSLFSVVNQVKVDTEYEIPHNDYTNDLLIILVPLILHLSRIF